jgi:hypothetical protein
MTKNKENKIAVYPPLQEHAKLAMEQIAKQKPATTEEVRAQFEISRKRGEISFAKDAPKVQEYLKEITTPLSNEDARDIGRWLFRKQITIEMIPKDVLVEWKETGMYEYIMRRIKEVEKYNATD